MPFKNLEIQKAYNKAYREANKDKYSTWNKAWKENNEKELQVYSKIWRDTNKEKLRNDKKAYYNLNKDKEREWHLNFKYGLNQESYDKILKDQNGCCAICKRTPKQLGKCLSVDHAHVAGYKHLSPEEKVKHVRGLLCDKCNRGLGHFEDKINLLKAAQQYLEPNVSLGPPA